jgi:hypothetical protein
MTKQPPIAFSERPVVILDLPLAANTRLLKPDQVLLRLGNKVHDVGSFCYFLRSSKKRNPNGPREVVLTSFRKERINQIRQVIRTFSNFLDSEGRREATVNNFLHVFKQFMDWADENGMSDCLAGGESTRHAYVTYAKDVDIRYRRHEFESSNASRLQGDVLTVLEAVTAISDLGKGIRFIKNMSYYKGGTEPVGERDFAHALALNESLFHGLCDLVLENQKFPFKLKMPKSLGWTSDFLWVVAAPLWSLPPHLWGDARTKMQRPNWTHNYEQGRVSTADEIWHHYSGTDSVNRSRARINIKICTQSLEAANSDPRNHHRRMLAMIAHNAFYFLFLANTSANAAPVADIETDGTIDAATINAGYRSTKWRAQNKEVSVVVPVALMPALRRFMELRKYLLDGKDFPYLFLSLGRGKRNSLEQINDACLRTQYTSLQRIDPALPRIGARKIRATALAYYRQRHDAEISAAVGQHTQQTADKQYDAGTENGQHIEMTLLLEEIALKAEQQIVKKDAISCDARPLEEGGACQSYGHPEAMANDVPVTPNCKTGCLFCTKRVLIASEEDACKVASAAFVMEQLIMGPMSEAEFRPQITKCDDDLARIRAFEGCADMVDRVKKDVFENGNLTPYFADKYQLFLALGVV